MLRRSFLKASILTAIAAKLGFWPQQSRADFLATVDPKTLLDHVKPGDVVHFEAGPANMPYAFRKATPIVRAIRETNDSTPMLENFDFKLQCKDGVSTFHGKLLFSEPKKQFAAMYWPSGKHAGTVAIYNRYTDDQWRDFISEIRIVPPPKKGKVA